MIVKTSQNYKTKFTRMCISEAIIELLETTPFEKLKVSAIVKRAGVARMTFYKYYDSPFAALNDYLDIIVRNIWNNRCGNRQKTPIWSTNISYIP